MKKNYRLPALLTIAALIGACSSMPASTSLLDQTRSDYAAAQGNPKTAIYAPLEMKQASDAMENANAAARANDSEEKIDRLAYLAKQKIALTQEVAKQKSAEADVANSAKERDQMLLNQRTIEADQARASAENARIATRIAKGDAAEAQRQTAEAQARTASLEAQLADLAAKKTARGIVITLGDVLFATDQAQLNADGIRTAQKLASVLQQHPQRSVLIEGFTDSTGSTAHNQELSERRAGAVRNVLTDMGVARERVAMRGYGEAFPIAANDTNQSRQLNRRVEIYISDNNGQIAPR